MSSPVFNEALMLEVRRRVLAEPRRLDMGAWYYEKPVASLRNFIGGLLGRRLACRTVCCIAGHVLEASGRSLTGRIESIAAGLLGLSAEEAEDLFLFDVCFMSGPYADLALELVDFDPGTSQYAQIVALAIDRCIERNRVRVEEVEVASV